MQSGRTKEFESLDESLGRLLEHLTKLGSQPTLLTVPGNHDLERPPVTNPTMKDLLGWVERGSIPNDLWLKPNHPARKLLGKSFKNYTRWVNHTWINKTQSVRRGLLPGDFATTFEKDGSRVGIIGLNTTYLQLQAGDFEGSLA